MIASWNLSLLSSMGGDSIKFLLRFIPTRVWWKLINTWQVAGKKAMPLKKPLRLWVSIFAGGGGKNFPISKKFCDLFVSFAQRTK